MAIGEINIPPDFIKQHMHQADVTCPKPAVWRFQPGRGSEDFIAAFNVSKRSFLSPVFPWRDRAERVGAVRGSVLKGDHSSAFLGGRRSMPRRTPFPLDAPLVSLQSVAAQSPH